VTSVAKGIENEMMDIATQLLGVVRYYFGLVVVQKAMNELGSQQKAVCSQ
jgi:hypothetical protein